jgi:hypothetical protein
MVLILCFLAYDKQAFTETFTSYPLHQQSIETVNLDRHQFQKEYPGRLQS